jgi:hypothetical protein
LSDTKVYEPYIRALLGTLKPSAVAGGACVAFLGGNHSWRWDLEVCASALRRMQYDECSERFVPEWEAFERCLQVPPPTLSRTMFDEMVSLQSIHPQTRQLNFISRNSKIKLTGLWVN